MKIDIFPHIFPRAYYERMQTVSEAAARYHKRRVSALPMLVDLEMRLKLMDQYPGYHQFLTAAGPGIENFCDPKVSPGKLMLDELVAGNIDATIIWGPTAGYYAKEYKGKAELVLLPMKDDPRNPEMKFVYKMAMAVRFGEKAWKDQVNQLIIDNSKEIKKILTDYNVPLIEP